MCVTASIQTLQNPQETKTHRQVMEADRQTTSVVAPRGCAGSMLSVSHKATYGGYQAREMKSGCPEGQLLQGVAIWGEAIKPTTERAASVSGQQRALQTPLPRLLMTSK